MQNVGGHYETWNTGVLGPVALHGLDQGKLDLSWAKWTYQVLTLFICFTSTRLDIYEVTVSISFLPILALQVGLKGEAMNVISPDGISSVDWLQGSLIAQRQQPLTWHKV